MEGKGASRNEMGEKGLQWNDNSNPRYVLLNIQHVRVTQVSSIKISANKYEFNVIFLYHTP